MEKKHFIKPDRHNESFKIVTSPVIQRPWSYSWPREAEYSLCSREETEKKERKTLVILNQINLILAST